MALLFETISIRKDDSIFILKGTPKMLNFIFLHLSIDQSFWTSEQRVEVKAYRFRGFARFSGSGLVDRPDPELVRFSGFDCLGHRCKGVCCLSEAASNPVRTETFFALDHVARDGGAAVGLGGLPLQVDPILVPVDHLDISRWAWFIWNIIEQYFFLI